MLAVTTTANVPMVFITTVYARRPPPAIPDRDCRNHSNQRAAPRDPAHLFLVDAIIVGRFYPSGVELRSCHVHFSGGQASVERWGFNRLSLATGNSVVLIISSRLGRQVRGSALIGIGDLLGDYCELRSQSDRYRGTNKKKEAQIQAGLFALDCSESELGDNAGCCLVLMQRQWKRQQ